MNRQARFVALSFLQKRAQGNVIDSLVDENSVVDFLDYLRDNKASDVQKVAEDVYLKLLERLSLSNAENEALNRLKSCIDNSKRWDLALIRNNIFKAGDSLGIKLPHSIFAAKRPGKDDAEIELECDDVDNVLDVLEDNNDFNYEIVSQTDDTITIRVEDYYSEVEIEEGFAEWAENVEDILSWRD